MSIIQEMSNVLEDQPSEGRLAVLSYCYAQQMALTGDKTAGYAELKTDLLMFPAPYDNRFLEPALSADLGNLDLWVLHQHEIYRQFFDETDQLRQYFLWVALRNYEGMRLFIAREEEAGNGILADYHRSDTLPAFAKLIQFVGKKALSKAYLEEIFEEEAEDVAWCTLMKRLLAELALDF